MYEKNILEQNVCWGDFSLLEIFDWQSQVEINPLHLKKLKISNEEKYPFYGQATINNGIITHCELQESVLNNVDGKPTILIHSNNQNTIYLETPFYLKDGHGATSVLQSNSLNKLNALFIMTSIKKVISERFSYNAKATKIGLKNTIVKLPVLSDGSLNYHYMETYIIQIQKNYIKSLENNRSILLRTYLTAAELSKYDLNDNDREVLALKPLWNEFTLSDLFDNIQQGARLKKLDQLEGNLPFVMAGTTNTGIVKFVGNKEIRRFPKNSITVDIFGNVFYRAYEYGAGDDTGVYWSEKITFSKEVMLYFCTALEVALRGKFSYGKKLRSSQSHSIKLKLPITSNGLLDLQYMESYIKAKQKFSIANVVCELDLEIGATKCIVYSKTDM